MSFLDRLSAGWQIALNSFKVLRANKQLIIFPILSGLSLLLVFASFFLALLGMSDWKLANIDAPGEALSYLVLFGYYIFNYFVIVFFNMALIHCCSLYYKGEEVTIRKGIDFSMSRIGKIFLWAVLAGSVGAILKIIQENAGWLGKIITGLIGVVWSIATFFVVPVIAYENLGPIDALKESAKMMKQKWGEGLGAGFSFGIINLIGTLMAFAIGFIVYETINPIAGIALGVLLVLGIATVLSAAKTIFISSIYHNITGDPVEHYNQQFVDGLFVSKK